MVKVSIVIAVLDSHEIVRRQLLHFNHFKTSTNKWEVIIMDDGSELPIRPIPVDYRLNIYPTGDTRPWSQPCARNAGAQLAAGEYLLMTDIDHVLTEQALQAVVDFEGDKMMFPRKWGVLNRRGRVTQDLQTLIEYGLDPMLYARRKLNAGQHANTFAMRKTLFDILGGYEERFCGKYGGDDTNFSNRYGQLARAGRAKRHSMGPAIYVYPDPRKDVKGVFHKLRFK